MLSMLWTGYRNNEWEEKFSEYCKIKYAGFSVDNTWGEFLNEKQLVEELKDIDVFFVGYDQVTENVLKQLPNLKLILSERDGPEENIDLAACEKMGIPVLNSSGRCMVSVAELTFNLILNMSRPVIRINSIIKDNGWTENNKQYLRNIVEEESYEVKGKTLGIVGLGRNGRYLAKLAQGFGMNVIAYDPFLDSNKVKKDLGVDIKNIEGVLTESDYITILARVTSENHGLIGKTEIQKMKPTAALVNTGRPQLLDYQALAEALLSGKLRMAALDVFDLEPIGENSIFYEIPEEKIILTSHIAGFSTERAWHQCKIAYENFTDFIINKKISNNCTPDVFKSNNFKKHGEKIFGTVK